MLWYIKYFHKNVHEKKMDDLDLTQIPKEPSIFFYWTLSCPINPVAQIWSKKASGGGAAPSLQISTRRKTVRWKNHFFFWHICFAIFPLGEKNKNSTGKENRTRRHAWLHLATFPFPHLIVRPL